MSRNTVHGKQVAFALVLLLRGSNLYGPRSDTATLIEWLAYRERGSRQAAEISTREAQNYGVYDCLDIGYEEMMFHAREQVEMCGYYKVEGIMETFDRERVGDCY